MTRSEVMLRLTETGVVPVLRTASADDTLRAVEALKAGGIPIAEITLTVPDAIQVIARCRAHFGNEVTLGAGSVTDAAACSEAIDAGSLFVVTPVLKPRVIQMCNSRKCLVIAGALTPTEIHGAWEAGADAVKVFPVKAVGGAAYLRMVREPLPHIPLVPTGGVDLDTLADYFRAGAALVGAGTDLVGRCWSEGVDREAIAARAGRYAAVIRSVRRPAGTVPLH